MVTEWNPNIPRQMVRGTSAWILCGNVFVALSVGFVCMILFIIGITVRGYGYDGSPILTTLLVIVVLSIVYHSVFDILYRRRLKQEARAGYTTCGAQPDELEEVDWKTGRVIRLGSEPRLSRKALYVRVAAVRSAAGSAAGIAGASRRR